LVRVVLLQEASCLIREGPTRVPSSPPSMDWIGLDLENRLGIFLN
jgi:hypothetical protein